MAGALVSVAGDQSWRKIREGSGATGQRLVAGFAGEEIKPSDFGMGGLPVGGADADIRPGLAAHEVRRVESAWARDHHELPPIVRHDFDGRQYIQVQAITENVSDPCLDALRSEQAHRLPLIVHADDDGAAARVL